MPLLTCAGPALSAGAERRLSAGSPDNPRRKYDGLTRPRHATAGLEPLQPRRAARRRPRDGAAAAVVDGERIGTPGKSAARRVWWTETARENQRPLRVRA